MTRAVRRRYIAFVTEGEGAPPPASAVDAAVLAVVRRLLPAALAEATRPRLYHLRPGAAIVRVEHTSQRAVVAALQGLELRKDARLRTVTTSGTLRQAKAALGVRESARRRRPGAPRARHKRPLGP